MTSCESAATALAGKTIAEKYELVKLIGSGSFGAIYEGLDTKTMAKVAIKLEQLGTALPQMLAEEARMMKQLSEQCDECGVPRIFWWGQEYNHSVMVMELLGQNLAFLLDQCGGKFSVKTVCLLADQMIDRMRFVHQNNLLHRDIKPENFITGTGAHSTKVYIVDFGLAKKFRDKRVKHIKFRQAEDRQITGTMRYASVNAHNGMELSRRDDMEALGYVLVYFVKGSLPWQGLRVDTDKERYKKVKEVKLGTPVEQLCRPIPVEFRDYLNYCRSLEFEQEPDYEFLKGLFRNLCQTSGFEYDGKFDWNAA